LYVSYLCYCIFKQVPYNATLVNTSTILKSVTNRCLLMIVEVGLSPPGDTILVPAVEFEPTLPYGNLDNENVSGWQGERIPWKLVRSITSRSRNST
jgi:hypothetical protein